MPFGLKNAAQGFQRLIDKILQAVPFVFVYLDDIVVASRSEEEHTHHLHQVFGILSNKGLLVKRGKCVLVSRSWTTSATGLQSMVPLPERMQALEAYPAPTDKAACQRFLGIINYYHRFLPNIAQQLAPLHTTVSSK